MHWLPEAPPSRVTSERAVCKERVSESVATCAFGNTFESAYRASLLDAFSSTHHAHGTQSSIPSVDE